MSSAATPANLQPSWRTNDDGAEWDHFERVVRKVMPFPAEVEQGRWWRVRQLLLAGEDAGIGLGEDPEFDQAFQLGTGAFDVLRQQFVAEGFADLLRT